MTLDNDTAALPDTVENSSSRANPQAAKAQALALVVPGCTDVNRGDQALVWEAARLLRDTGCFDSIVLLDVGDTPEEREQQSRQTRKIGYPITRAILRHPRRGRHDEGDR